MSLTMEIKYPPTLPDTMGRSQAEFEEEAKWAMAVKLFEMRRISLEMAAGLVGVDSLSFLLKLNDYEVPMGHLSDEDFRKKLKNIILDTLEKYHPDYEKMMAEAVNSALEKADTTPALTPDEFGEWLPNVAD